MTPITAHDMSDGAPGRLAGWRPPPDGSRCKSAWKTAGVSGGGGGRGPGVTDRRESGSNDLHLSWMAL